MALKILFPNYPFRGLTYRVIVNELDHAQRIIGGGGKFTDSPGWGSLNPVGTSEHSAIQIHGFSRATFKV